MIKNKKVQMNKKQVFNNAICLVFLLGVIVAVVQFFIFLFSTNPPFIVNFPIFHHNYTDSFMDFFNINYFVMHFNPYNEVFQSSYPPFNFILALPFMLITKYISPENADGGFIYNTSLGKCLSLGLYFAVSALMIIILVILFAKKYKLDKSTVYSLVVISVVSSPFLFLLERANYVIMTFFFTGMFLLLKDSNNKVTRFFALLFLAMASATKLYPAAFALFLIKDKRIKDTLIFAILTVALLTLPFFLFEGGFVYNFKAFINNLSSFASYDRLSIDVSTGNLLRILVYIFGGNYLSETVSTIAIILRVTLFITAVAISFISKDKWQIVTMLALLSVIFPSPAMIHSLIYVIFGFALWFIKKQKTKMDFVYAVYFFLMITPCWFGNIINPVPFAEVNLITYVVNPNYLGLTVNTFLQGLSAVLMLITISVEVIIKRTKR